MKKGIGLCYVPVPTPQEECKPLCTANLNQKQKEKKPKRKGMKGWVEGGRRKWKENFNIMYHIQTSVCDRDT